MRYRTFVLCLAMAALLVFIVGCGGNSTPVASAPQPTPQPTPSPTPSPTPPPPTPPPPSGSNAEQYTIHLVTQSASGADVGQVTLNATANDGAGTLTLHGVDASKSYTLQFCPQSGASCIGLGSFTTDGSGNATFNFKFPEPGIWAGYFTVSGGSVAIADGMFGGATGGKGLQAALYPVKSVTSGIASVPEAKIGSEPLSSGQLTVNNGVVTTTLKGAAPNSTYTFVYVLGYALYGTSSDYGSTGSVSTDASGNASGSFGEVFNAAEYSFLALLADSGGAEYVAGFRVQ